jgi:hypothetical protein
MDNRPNLDTKAIVDALKAVADWFSTSLDRYGLIGKKEKPGCQSGPMGIGAQAHISAGAFPCLL